MLETTCHPGDRITGMRYRQTSSLEVTADGELTTENTENTAIPDGTQRTLKQAEEAEDAEISENSIV